MLLVTTTITKLLLKCLWLVVWLSSAVDKASGDVQPKRRRAECDDLPVAVSQRPPEAWSSSQTQNEPCTCQSLRTRYCETTRTHRFNGHLPGEPESARFPSNFSYSFSPKLCILPGQTKSFHILFGTIPPCLRQTLLCLVLSTSTFVRRLIQSVSSLRSICPNRLNLPFLITKLTQTGFNPNSSLNSAFFYLSFKVNHAKYGLAGPHGPLASSGSSSTWIRCGRTW